MKRRVDFFSHFSGVNKKGATDFYFIFSRGGGESMLVTLLCGKAIKLFGYSFHLSSYMLNYEKY